MQQFLIVRYDEDEVITGFFTGIEFSESISDSKLYTTAQDARATAGILQKDELDSSVLVKKASISISIAN